MTGPAHSAAALGALLLLCAGCDFQHDRLLQRPIELVYDNGLLTTFGNGAAAACDPTVFDQPGPAIFDTATPLTAFRSGRQPALQHFGAGELRLVGADGTGQAGASNYFSCSQSIISVPPDEPSWTLSWGGASTGPLALVMGGDLLRLYAVGLTFTTTALPPQGGNPRPGVELPATTTAQLRLGFSDIASNCALADRGAAVLPFTPLGGGLLVQVGEEVISYPTTRVTLPACAEPLSDPLPACWSQGLPCDGAPPQPSCFRQPTFCSTPSVQRARDPHYTPTGVNLNLLVSTALPGFVLSRSAFSRLRPDAAAVLSKPPDMSFHFPGIAAAQPGWRVQIGRAGFSPLVLVSKERFLSPCDELARRRRQNYAYYYYGLPTGGAGDGGAGAGDGGSPAESHLDAPACLIDLTKNVGSSQQQGCTYSGDIGLGCVDVQAPMAAVIELEGALDAVVIEDTAPILQAVSADLNFTGPQIDGILGVSVLSLLQTEIDAQKKRVTATCRSPAHCRLYPRLTYNYADDCSINSRHPLATVPPC